MVAAQVAPDPGASLASLVAVCQGDCIMLRNHAVIALRCVSPFCSIWPTSRDLAPYRIAQDGCASATGLHQKGACVTLSICMHVLAALGDPPNFQNSLQ